MTAIPQGVDAKTVDRIKKLLNLARDGGATEAEASLAMDRAQSIMREHGLSVATIEASGGVGESREKREARGRAHKQWMRDIMESLADSSFVHASYVRGHRGSWDGVLHPARWTLIGRQSAVVQVELMHEYLVRTVDRVARERGTPADELFKSGMGERLVERLRTRHADMLAQQKREADETRARRSNHGAPGALVVVLEDYGRKERDLNEDLRRGVEPGTTERERAEDLRLREERRLEKERRAVELAERGFSEDEIFYIQLGYSEDEARKLAAPKTVEPKEETEEQRAKREAREAREEREYWERRARREARDAERRNNPSYRAGRAAGDRVGLDTQVNQQQETRKLS